MNNKTDEINNVLKDDFIMSPKLDFAFKLLFGDESNIELLRAKRAKRESCRYTNN